MSRTYKKSYEYQAFDICKAAPVINSLFKRITIKKVRSLKNMKIQDGSLYKRLGRLTGAKKFDNCNSVKMKVVNPVKRNYLKHRTEAKRNKTKLLIKVSSSEFKEND